MDIVLDASVRAEADPNGLAPTASSAAAMAVGDALALALMQARCFTPEHFAQFHPAGQLGFNLALTACEVMHPGARTAWAAPGDSLKQVVIAMTEHPLGAACVVGPDGALVGLITEGDLRRALQTCDDIRELRAGDVMTAHPVTVRPDTRLHEALRMMENRPSQIYVLPVVEASGRCLGLLRLHDIYQGRAARP
jgi:arabinose-5-phosphate isomerase